MRVIPIFLLISFLCLNVRADEISDELVALGYIEKEVPTIGSDAWSAANRSYPSLYVEKGQSLSVRKATSEETDPGQVIFDSGSIKYIGIDRGEFGGGLYIDTVKPDAKPFFKGNIRALFPINNDLYIVTGLAHMGFSGGAIHVIRNYREPSIPEQVTLLPDAPEAISIDKSWRGNNNFLIAGHSSLMIFVPDHTLEIVKYDTFWSSLYPSSIVEYKKSYIIGIRSGIAVVTPSYGTSEVRYFVPN